MRSLMRPLMSLIMLTGNRQFGDKNVGDSVDVDGDRKNTKEKDNENIIVYKAKNVGGVSDVMEIDNEKVDEAKEDDNDGNEEAKDDGDKNKKNMMMMVMNKQKIMMRHSDNDSDSNDDGKGPDKHNIILNEDNVDVENIEKSNGSGDKGDENKVRGKGVYR
ncbi:conserved hypothetical protein [Ricinus communis]|uniref:Uncharacterized protein n=1 Tax=Ricinus communis TaxID=3988 RepID=B9SD28_RICCO|nr:conserved hypothetical protein [Ricinus communis]